MLQRRWAMSRNHGARNTRSSFGQQSLWCWSSWRSLYGAGGRDSSKVALGGPQGLLFCNSPCLPALLSVLRYGSPALGFFSQPAPALRHV
jgi:hypothetical protein